MPLLANKSRVQFLPDSPVRSTSWEGKQSTGAWHGGGQSVQLLQTIIEKGLGTRRERELRDRERQQRQYDTLRVEATRGWERKRSGQKVKREETWRS